MNIEFPNYDEQGRPKEYSRPIYKKGGPLGYEHINHEMAN